MADRLPSDHDAVQTHRGPVSQVGRTGRPEVAIPDALPLEDGDVIHLVLDGEQYHGQVETTLEGDTVIRRAADNARLVREGEGEDRLSEWFDAIDVAFGDSVHFDVVTEGHKYGLRSPGNRVVYSATDRPDSSLTDIARNLDG